jgi:hypothetical protein
VRRRHPRNERINLDVAARVMPKGRNFH